MLSPPLKTRIIEHTQLPCHKLFMLCLYCFLAMHAPCIFPLPLRPDILPNAMIQNSEMSKSDVLMVSFLYIFKTTEVQFKNLFDSIPTHNEVSLKKVKGMRKDISFQLNHTFHFKSNIL